MERELHKARGVLVGAVALGVSLGVAACAMGANASGVAAASTQQCQTVKVKKRIRRWVWVVETKRVHGRLVIVRVHGRAVRVHRRLPRTALVTKVACTSGPAAATAVATAPLAAFAPGAPGAVEPSLLASSPAPLNVAPPTISGASRQGQVLVATTGIWRGVATGFSYEWMRCDATGADCAGVVLAATPSYVLAQADIAHTVRVAVIASGVTGGLAAATSAPTEPVSASLQPPVNRALPAIAGAVQQGRALSHAEGSWANEPASESDQWLQCDASGGSCQPIAGATADTYMPGAGDAGHSLRVRETASNAAGSSAPATSAPSELVAAAEQLPVNTIAPAIGGTAQPGQTLTASPGSWTGSPAAFSYEWLRCDATGASCVAISLATTATYGVSEADIGATLRVSVTASNAAGSSAPATSAPSEVVVGTEQPPANTILPAISGSAQPGQTLTAIAGSWTNNPSTFAYRWKRCNASGANCNAILGANSASLTLGEEDLGSTLRVTVTASNAAGSSTPATSAPSEVVTATQQPPSNTIPPAISGTAQQGQALSASPGSWTGSPTSFGYEWLRCDTAGSNCTSIALATHSTYTVSEADVGATLRVSVVASNAAGSSSPSTSAPTEVVAAAERPPSNTSPPVVTGTAQQGQTLSASPGSWTGSPTSFGYEWLRCDTAGSNCASIALATHSSYTVSEADVGATLRIAVLAFNSAGSSAPAQSAQSAVVKGAEGVRHLEYVAQDGVISVYDIDHGFERVQTIVLPQTADGVRGVTVAPSTHRLYVMHGGDGPANSSGNGSVLAYDLVSEKVVWNVTLNTGIDSGQVSPDGTKLYVPTGENSPSGIWNVLSAASGEVIGTIQGGTLAHNTVASGDGRYVYLGSRGYNYLDVYETTTGVVRKIGPMVGTVRPFTVNGSNTLAFTTATAFDGFQISSVTTGSVLFTESFGEIPTGFPFTTASHGIGLSPDERLLYVIDAVHEQVQIWDVSKVKEGGAPAHLGAVPVSGLSGNESPCVYDCGHDGWLQLSRDGRYVFVGDSGDVIDTTTDNVVTTLSTLAQTKVSIEVDWQGGVPVATSGRTGVGYVP